MNIQTIVIPCLSLITALSPLAWSESARSAGDPVRGAAVFQACAACHSTMPGVHMTGPSLAKIWQRKAGTVEGFSRYSEAMKHVNLVWNEETLDQWLSNPEGLIPGTSMTFPGLRDSKARQDVIGYLEAVSEGKAPAGQSKAGGMMMNMQPSKEDLKKAPPQGEVTATSLALPADVPRPVISSRSAQLTGNSGHSALLWPLFPGSCAD